MAANQLGCWGIQETRCISLLYVPLACWLHTPVTTWKVTTQGAGNITGTNQHHSSNPTCLLSGTLAAKERQQNCQVSFPEEWRMLHRTHGGTKPIWKSQMLITNAKSCQLLAAVPCPAQRRMKACWAAAATCLSDKAGSLSRLPG